MAQKLNPFSGRQFLDAAGEPYVGAKLFTYVAGSTTKATTTKDLAGASAHANPIILNSRGEPGDGAGAAQAIWQAEGVNLKLVLAPANDTDPPVSAISTWDNISGINDAAAAEVNQWASGPVPTYVSATSFTLVGDQTTDFHVGRRIKTTNSGGDIYSTITVTAYTTLTTVTVVNDSGVVDSGLSAVSYGILTATNDSVPRTASFTAGTLMLFQQTAAPMGWTKETTHDDKAFRVVSGTASSGGTKAFTTTFGTSKTTDGHTLIVAEMPSHKHTLTNTTSGAGAGTYIVASPTSTGSSAVADSERGSTGGDTAHSHALTNFDLQYVDIIIARKD